MAKKELAKIVGIDAIVIDLIVKTV